MNLNAIKPKVKPRAHNKNYYNSGITFYKSNHKNNNLQTCQFSNETQGDQLFLVSEEEKNKPKKVSFEDKVSISQRNFFLK